MADYEIDDPEMEIVCPYDKAHMVRKKRMQYHLLKCRKNHPTKDFAVCPFNATHEMPKPELRHHMLTCRDRAVAEKTIRHEEAKRSETNQPILKGNTDVPAYNTYQLIETEDWDKEIPANPKMGVDPSFFHMKTRGSLAGLTPLEKRQFHTSLLPDMADYFVDENEEYRPVGMAPEPKKERNVRLPKAKSQAETLYQQQNSQVRKPKAPSAVFQYSLATAGVGRGMPPQQIPASLQAYSMKNAKRNRDSSPPASIKAYILKDRRKASSITSDNTTNISANNSANGAFSDDEDFDGVKPNITQVQAHPGQNHGTRINDYVLKQPGHGRGRGSVRRQNEKEVYIAPVMKPVQNTGIGRGARLQNGNLQPEPSNSWASMVNDSRQSTPPPNFYSSNDFSTLNNFPPLNQSNNGQVNIGSLSNNSSGRNTPNNWFDEDIMVDVKNHGNDEILESAKKQSKSLRKKLAGISKLEDKKKKGVKLTPDELAKVNKRGEFEKELAKLSITN